jgi:lysine biosynthesis protein LysW
MCGANVTVASNAKEGDLVYCDACDAELEVVSVKPLELDWPLDDYEEYDDDYDDDDDDDYDDYDDDDYDDD